MKEITLFELDNGETFRSKVEAEKRQREVEFEDTLSAFVNKHVNLDKGRKKTLIKAIIENKLALKNILSMAE